MHVTRWAEDAAWESFSNSQEPSRRRALMDALEAAAPLMQGDDDTSDGHHTFRELYRHRMLLNAGLFRVLAACEIGDVHKSWRHSDGKLCFGGGWFIVVAQLPTGQVSYHYPADAWDLFRIPERETPATFDEHTPADVLDRLQWWIEGDEF